MLEKIKQQHIFIDTLKLAWSPLGYWYGKISPS